MPLAGPAFSREAEEVFASHLADLAGGGPVGLEALNHAFERVRAKHPSLADDLWGLQERWLAGVVRQVAPSATVTDWLRSQFGGEADPQVSLHEEPGDEESDFTSDFLHRLAGRGAAYGRYKLKGEVARGAQGAILKIWDEDLRRDLAMKVILGKDEDGDATDTPKYESKALARFLEEAQVTAQLDHPGIVPVHELGLDSERRVYFTMKLVRGESLRAVITRVHADEEEWTLTRALGVMLRICEAMGYSHAKGVIHRDLKPSNVMVGRYGEVFVMDWGLAHVLGTEQRKDIRIQQQPTVELYTVRHDAPEDVDSPLLTMEGDVVGTPAYMSPEQARGELDEMGPQSDVYSVGAMLYHLLTGDPPYVEPGVRLSSRMILYLVQKGPPPRLHDLVPDTPAELVAICEKAMERDWRDRYADTSELAKDLSAYLEHRVVSAYRTGAVAELRKWVERNRGLATALATGLVVLVGWLVTSIVLRGVAETRLDDFMRLSALQNVVDLEQAAQGLWPARPHDIDAYRDWIHDAQGLVDDLPMHRERLAELRANALPRTAEELRAQRTGHPGYAELERLAGEIAFRRRALHQRRDGVAAELPEIDGGAYPDDPVRLIGLAREYLDPDRARFGDEALGLALALRALERTPETPEAVEAVAWGCFALGRDEEALDASYAAFELAPEERKDELGESLEELELAVAEASSAEALRATAIELSELEERHRLLESRVNEPTELRFPAEDRELPWWNSQLTKLIRGLEGLERDLLAEEAMSPEYGWSVPLRLTFAQEMREGYADGGRHAVRWARDLPAIRAGYPGLELEPQLGLVPLGPDPDSGLWEFGHLGTGTVAERGRNGRLLLTEETGLVFVLLPGGTFTMGAQAVDPRGANYDPQAETVESPVHEVTLAPFFVSKYEMTQGQWLRSTGDNPSLYDPGEIPGGHGTLLHPVEQVSWHDCFETLRRHGLLLPTEAQWEYAARGTTSTPWWTGEMQESLRGKVNIADQSLRRAGAPYRTPEDWPDLDDGHAVHGPVNAYPPNPFGLHDVLGSLHEWCREANGASYHRPAREGDGERNGEFHQRTYRGGDWQGIAAHARVAHRSADSPAYKSYALGVRPSRALEP